MLVFLSGTGAHGADIPADAPADLERYSYPVLRGPFHRRARVAGRRPAAGAAPDVAGEGRGGLAAAEAAREPREPQAEQRQQAWLWNRLTSNGFVWCSGVGSRR